ncbi:MAG: TolC family outer membrane protein [Magnetococcales bacterium]|nr:TolC family outer membrane protein [Magnetococcales bacterium]
MPVKRGFLAITILLGIFSAGPIHPAQTLTLSEAVQEALRAHPKFLAAGREVEETRQKMRQAVAGYFPTVDLNVSTGREWVNTPTTRGLSDSGLTMERGEAGMNINQPIFDGFNTVHKVEQAKAQIQSNDHALMDVAETVTLDVALSYLELLKQRILLGLAKEAVSTHTEILNKTRQTAQMGITAEMDTRLAESRVALIESDLAASFGALKAAESHFESLINLPASSVLVPPVIDPRLLPATREEALRMALERHPALLAAQADLEASRAESKATGSSLWPKISLDMSVSESNNASGSRSYSQDASAMVQLRYNLFRGGSDSARLEESAFRAARVQDKLNETRLQIEEKLNRAWNARTASQTRKQSLEKHVETTQAVNLDHQEQHKLGSETLLDLLNSEHELQSARRLLAEEDSQFLSESYRLLAAMGKLKEALIGADPTPPPPVPPSTPQNSTPPPEPIKNTSPLVMEPEEALNDLVHALFQGIETERGQTTPVAMRTPPRPIQYTVQVGSFRDESSAIQLIGQLQDKGYDLYLQEIRAPPEQTWYRVSIGRMANEIDAQTLLQRFSAQESRSGIITTVVKQGESTAP